MTVSGSCRVPLLGLSVSDECINKIILSGFLMSVLLWILFQMAGEPRTPQDEPGTPRGAAEQRGVCSTQGRVAPLVCYRSASPSWDRDISHEHPCVSCNNGLRRQQGQVWVCCTALLCSSGCGCSRWAHRAASTALVVVGEFLLLLHYRQTESPFTSPLGQEKRLRTQWQHWERRSWECDGFLCLRMQHAQWISMCSKWKCSQEQKVIEHSRAWTHKLLWVFTEHF